MNSGKNVPAQRKNGQQDGQSLIEFILLLLVVVTLSFAFISVSNRNLGRFWEAYVRLIVDDPSQNGAITIPN